MLKLDHILYAVPELKRAMDEFEALTGIQPVFGGKHPTLGTLNALVSLGDNIYFELIAADPEANLSPDKVIFGIGKIQKPKIITWAVRTIDIENYSGSITISNVQNGSRKKSDGTELKWKTAEILDFEDDTGIVPFVIQWGDTIHPAKTSPKGCQLLEMTAKHPKPNKFKALLSEFSFELPITNGPFEIRVKLETPNGIVEIV